MDILLLVAVDSVVGVVVVPQEGPALLAHRGGQGAGRRGARPDDVEGELGLEGGRGDPGVLRVLHQGPGHQSHTILTLILPNSLYYQLQPFVESQVRKYPLSL